MTNSIFVMIVIRNEETFQNDLFFSKSELLEDIDERFPRYYIHSDKLSMFKF